jgi:alpha/beta superfamily hydrolase
MPGLAADSKVFENLEFDTNRYRLHYLSWIMPLSSSESIASYASRLLHQVKEENPVLIGVSFGGIIVQELAKFVAAKKVIIISSIKHQDELPIRFKFAKKTKIRENTVHIHGTNDAVFPIKKIKNVIKIQGGTHIMILTKAKKISKLIDTILTC